MYAVVNVSEPSRATVYPGELSFTPKNWADPKVACPFYLPLHPPYWPKQIARILH